MENNTVLVAGGAGYIGSTTCKFLKKKGYNIVVFDNLSTGSSQAVKWGEFVLGDICDYSAIKEAIYKFNVKSIVHFAGCISVGESVKNPSKYYHNNVYGTLCLLNAMKECCVKNIVFSSSAAVYGVPGGDSNCISEEVPLSPINPYGNTKKVCEKMIVDFAKSYSFNYALLRYFNACGAEHDIETGWYNSSSTNLIPIVTKALANNDLIKIFGSDYSTKDGTCIRDYVHVEDLAFAHIKSLKFLIESGKNITLNLGSGTGTSVLELIKVFEKIKGEKVNFCFHERRVGDPAILVADPGLAMKTIGWKTQYSLEDIVKTGISWHEKHFV